MYLFEEYLSEIKEREKLGLSAKPIDCGRLLTQIVSIIDDKEHRHYADAVSFMIYNVLPGTTSAAKVKANFLKSIIDDERSVVEISTSFAFELLSHMRGGSSIDVLLDFALGSDPVLSGRAIEVLKTQVFLNSDDIKKLQDFYKKGSKAALEVLESYANAEFFRCLPDLQKIRSCCLRCSNWRHFN